jgi:hypothetical protein
MSLKKPNPSRETVPLILLGESDGGQHDTGGADSHQRSEQCGDSSGGRLNPPQQHHLQQHQSHHHQRQHSGQGFETKKRLFENLEGKNDKKNIVS